MSPSCWALAKHIHSPGTSHLQRQNQKVREEGRHKPRWLERQDECPHICLHYQVLVKTPSLACRHAPPVSPHGGDLSNICYPVIRAPPSCSSTLPTICKHHHLRILWRHRHSVSPISGSLDSQEGVALISRLPHWVARRIK